MAVPTARQLARDLLPPPRLPLSEAAVWSVALPLMLAVLLADILTPASLAVGTLLSASVAFAALGASRRAAWQLTLLAVLANLTAGLWNGLRDGVKPTDLANRAVSILAVLLVGYLTIRARQASERAAALQEEERQLRRERALRILAEDMGGSLGQVEFVERAAAALQKLTGATVVEIGALDRAMLRAPHALACAPGQDIRRHPGRLNTRLPLEFLAHPVGAGDLWTSGDGATCLARLRRPAEGDLLVMLAGAATPPALTGEALRALQPLLERTALLDDLREGRAQLAEQGELLRDLIYAFSHDLRTPLLAGAMNMQAALRGAYGPLPEAYRATLVNGLSATETLIDLADQLLLVAQYESGEATEEDRTRVDLRELSLSVVNDLRPRAEARHVTLDLQLEGARVCGRRHDLRRAVQNLVDNAVKFSPPGRTVCVRLTQDGQEATFSVQDDGPGVPPQREGRLFQRFRSGGAGGGTGLGLYLTRRIAEAHGGSVRYSRTANAHSRFTLTIPLKSPYE